MLPIRLQVVNISPASLDVECRHRKIRYYDHLIQRLIVFYREKENQKLLEYQCPHFFSSSMVNKKPFHVVLQS